MKTHEHALISLGYGACISLLLGGDLSSHPGIYLAAVLGGECIDFIDHPLYHLVYRRKDAFVSKARKIFLEKGVLAARRYLSQVEDHREFTGLLLHNIYGLAFLSALTLSTYLLAPGEYYIQVFFSAWLLHMLTDLVGDLQILGHINNWLWVLPDRARQQSMPQLLQVGLSPLLSKLRNGLVGKGKFNHAAVVQKELNRFC